jgi:hypothetical protein
MPRWHLVRSYTRSDGTRVRSYVARNPRRTRDFVVSVTIASLAISSSGSSAAESADKPDEGKVSVTLSSDDVQASYERAAGRILRSGYRYKDLHLSIDNNCVANS